MFGFFSDFVDSVVDVASSVGNYTVEVVSDVAGVVGDVASSTASFTFDVLGDVATGVGNLAEGTIDLSTDILGALLAPIFDPTYFDPKKEQQREAAERRFERQVNGLR